jgi:hypothetical protein
MVELGRKMRKKYYSWEIINMNVAIKLTDKSVFDYNQTGIPIEIRPFWNAEGLGMGQTLNICLSYGGKKYKAHIQMDNSSLLRTKLLWPKDLTRHLHYENGFPYMRFEKGEDNNYLIDFIYETDEENLELDGSDIWYKVSTDDTMGVEGRRIEYYTSKYERNRKNRDEAIKIHGLRCSVCNFCFQEKYGDLGQGFIEIHHIKPLFSLEEEVKINPGTDLRPVCSNCHKMIHRRKGRVYTIEELKFMINKNSNEE